MTQRIRTPRRIRDSQPAARPQRRRRPRRQPSRQPPQQPRQRGGFGMRWLSLLLCVLIIAAGVVVFTNSTFYVTRAEIGGVRYVPAEEIFTESGIAGYHILWVDPEVVAGRIAALPDFSSAQVIVQWPARVVILVREREPALVWEQSGRRYWVDVNGHLMIMRRDLPELVRVVNEGEEIPFHCPGPACREADAVTIDPAVVRGAQQLKTLRSGIDVLYYDPVHGLSYRDGRGWRGYFGSGTDMDRKLHIYEELAANLEGRGIRPTYIDVSNPDAPFYRVTQ
jgi:hypothetical protein